MPVWLTWIVLGLVAGILAKLIIPGNPAGCIVTILLGIAGAFVGGVAWRAAWHCRGSRRRLEHTEYSYRDLWCHRAAGNLSVYCRPKVLSKWVLAALTGGPGPAFFIWFPAAR